VAEGKVAALMISGEDEDEGVEHVGCLWGINMRLKEKPLPWAQQVNGC
jgi:hypothetical protein